MTQEDKELLLKDLCARLPYGVKIYYQKLELPFILFEINLKGEVLTLTDDMQTNYFVQYVQNSKLYLRPMSSMTEEEESQRIKLTYFDGDGYALFDWLNAHHFDFRGLIPKGLALEAPEGMYN